jgi:hypothetical protein
MPGAGASLDLQFHELASGVRDGFAAGIGAASGSAGESNYLLVNFAQTPRRALDVGVVNANGSGLGYTAEAVPAALVAWMPSGGIGPLTMPAGRTLVLTEVQLPAGHYLARVVPGSGASIDWGLTVHGGTDAVQAKANALAAAWAAPAGQAEECLFEATVDGIYCFAVWKVGATNLADSAQYALEIEASVVGVDDDIALPTVTRLRVAGQNPFRVRTQLAFDLAREGEVSLDVFDLRGARVRRLTVGHRNVGSHLVAWDGRDADGRSLAAGVYFARLAVGGRSWSTKVVLLE